MCVFTLYLTRAARKVRAVEVNCGGNGAVS